MKRTTIWIGAAAMLLAAFSSVACKKADVETKTLTVIVSAGVSGSPAAGEYTVELGADQAYSYSLDAGYEKLTVLLDGNAIAASGTFTVSGDHVLQAFSDDNNDVQTDRYGGDGRDRDAGGRHLLLPAGDEVPYSYALAAGYKGLSVKVEGARPPAAAPSP